MSPTSLRIAILSLLVLGNACGETSPTSPDASSRIDADVVVPAGCAGLLSSYDLAGATYTGYARPRDAGDPASPTVYGMTASLDQGPPPDVFEIQLWSDFGVFADEVAPGTFPITGAETSLIDCGLCALIFGDLASNGTTSTVLVAQSGTFTIDDISLESGARFRGSAPELEYRQVNASGPVPGGCGLTVRNIDFDVTLDAP